MKIPPDRDTSKSYTQVDVSRWAAPDIRDLIKHDNSSAMPERSIRWVEIPSAKYAKTSGTVWHYTDQQGLLGMVTRGEIWASSAATLNDSKEIRTGVEALQARLGEWQGDIEIRTRQYNFAEEMLTRSLETLKHHRVFVLSASLAGDQLSQWRGYGGGQSYAVALDVNPALRPLSKRPILQHSEGYPPPWTRVAYRKTKIQDQVDATIRILLRVAPTSEDEEFVATGIAESVLWRILPYLKHKSFKEEKEARLCHIAPPHSWPNRESALSFRPGERMPTPYLSLGVHPDEQFGYWALKLDGKLPLRAVRMGPGGPKEKAKKKALRALLDHYGYENVRIRHSKSTFR